MWDLKTWSQDQTREMKKSIRLLMEAAGQTPEAVDYTKSLPELLEVFFVGTEKKKV